MATGFTVGEECLLGSLWVRGGYRVHLVGVAATGFTKSLELYFKNSFGLIQFNPGTS